MVSPDLAVSFFALMSTPVMHVFVLYSMPTLHYPKTLQPAPCRMGRCFMQRSI